jgi:hypothetical protein
MTGSYFQNPIYPEPPTILDVFTYTFKSDHAAIADGTSIATDHLPRYFAKSGHVDNNPNKMKKNGAGKGGW